MFSACKANEFQCAMGQCVRIGTLCDGFIDCPDFSDEMQGCGKLGTVTSSNACVVIFKKELLVFTECTSILIYTHVHVQRGLDRFRAQTDCLFFVWL